MRKAISILLLALFGASYITPVFASVRIAGDAVPACCRRDGRHRCQMSMDDPGNSTAQNPQWSAQAEKCPYRPQALSSGHPDPLSLAPVVITLLPIASHPAGVAQTESMRRIAKERSRQKRGPPSPSL